MIHNPIIYNNTDWVRPADWLPIDHLVNRDTPVSPATSVDGIAILIAVYPNEVNDVAWTVRAGTYTDWGDGNISTNAGLHSHVYDYDSIPDSTICSRGYKQVIARLYNITTYRITRWYLSTPSTGGLITPNILDIKLHTPNIDQLLFGDNTRKMPMVEQIKWLGTFDYVVNTPTEINLYYCTNLQHFEIDCPERIGAYYITPFLTPVFASYIGRNVTYRFYWNLKIKEFIGYDTTTQTSTLLMFGNCFNIEKVSMNVDSVTTIQSMFSNCFNIRIIELYNCENIETVTTWAVGVTNVARLILQGLKVTISVANFKLSGTAMNDLFTSLGTPATPQTIKITGNPAVSDPTTDRTIATAKNWTVVA